MTLPKVVLEMRRILRIFGYSSDNQISKMKFVTKKFFTLLSIDVIKMNRNIKVTSVRRRHPSTIIKIICYSREKLTRFSTILITSLLEINRMYILSIGEKNSLLPSKMRKSLYHLV
jgi:hypothetical protein